MISSDDPIGSAYILYWEDDRSSGKEFVTNIFAQKFTHLDLNTGKDFQPGEFRIYQNYPNPFNASTTFQFEVGDPGDISITIYNLLGQKSVQPVNGFYMPGSYHITWDTSKYQNTNIGSGVYIYQYTSQSHHQTRRLTLLK